VNQSQPSSDCNRLTEITLAFFVEQVDDASRQKYEVRYTDPATGVAVMPVFVATG
jgi:hypothetical protein